MENSLSVLGLISAIVLIILLATCIICKLQYKKICPTTLKSTVTLNYKGGLSEQGLFWLAILAPTLLFITSGLIAWPGHSLSLDANGFKTFYQITALPIAILALSVPLSALVAKLHSTAQTAAQIEKGKHDLFYLHRKEYVSYYEQIGATKFSFGLEAQYKMNPRIHARFFYGEPANGTPVLLTDIVDTQISRIKEARHNLEIVLTNPPSAETKNSLCVFCQRIQELAGFLGITDFNSLFDSGLPIHGSESKTVRTPGTKLSQAVDAYYYAENYLTSTIEFAGYAAGKQEIDRDKVDFVRLFNNSTWELSDYIQG
ncbi:hypothetical protein LOY24_17795 [Pseudomonas putida]|uniref:hypothetical protein n=1 Tax=Pseudomonas putida TaxID=303 RepID=UPI00215FAB54|nr:hypothetical protein [Pseudomonas putida]UVL76578.1 hypothetical protein LOY24_17795 [Pseudomonas putida]